MSKFPKLSAWYEMDKANICGTSKSPVGDMASEYLHVNWKVQCLHVTFDAGYA